MSEYIDHHVSEILELEEVLQKSIDKIGDTKYYIKCIEFLNSEILSGIIELRDKIEVFFFFISYFN